MTIVHVRKRTVVRAGSAFTYPTPIGDAHVDRAVDEVTWARVCHALTTVNVDLAEVTHVTVDDQSTTVYVWPSHRVRVPHVVGT